MYFGFSPFKNYKKMKKSRLYLLLVIISGLTLWASILWLTWGEKAPNTLLIDIGKSGASLSLITVIGGLTQQILKERENAKQQREATYTFYRNILTDLKSVFDKVEKARLLIEAHRSAKTYSEQCRELINGVVILHNIKRATNTIFPILDEDIRPSINAMSLFIKELLKEYRNNYKEIALLQEVYEERKNQFKKSILNKDNITEKDFRSEAWEKIQGLPKLSILRDDNKFHEYESKFLQHLDYSSKILRTRLPVEEETL